MYRLSNLLTRVSLLCKVELMYIHQRPWERDLLFIITQDFLLRPFLITAHKNSKHFRHSELAEMSIKRKRFSIRLRSLMNHHSYTVLSFKRICRDFGQIRKMRFNQKNCFTNRHFHDYARLKNNYTKNHVFEVYSFFLWHFIRHFHKRCFLFFAFISCLLFSLVYRI